MLNDEAKRQKKESDIREAIRQTATWTGKTLLPRCTTDKSDTKPLTIAAAVMESFKDQIWETDRLIKEAITGITPDHIPDNLKMCKHRITTKDNPASFENVTLNPQDQIERSTVYTTLPKEFLGRVQASVIAGKTRFPAFDTSDLHLPMRHFLTDPQFHENQWQNLDFRSLEDYKIILDQKFSLGWDIVTCTPVKTYFEPGNDTVTKKPAEIYVISGLGVETRPGDPRRKHVAGHEEDYKHYLSYEGKQEIRQAIKRRTMLYLNACKLCGSDIAGFLPIGAGVFLCNKDELLPFVLEGVLDAIKEYNFDDWPKHTHFLIAGDPSINLKIAAALNDVKNPNVQADPISSELIELLTRLDNKGHKVSMSNGCDMNTFTAKESIAPGMGNITNVTSDETLCAQTSLPVGCPQHISLYYSQGAPEHRFDYIKHVNLETLKKLKYRSTAAFSKSLPYSDINPQPPITMSLSSGALPLPTVVDFDREMAFIKSSSTDNKGQILQIFLERYKYFPAIQRQALACTVAETCCTFEYNIHKEEHGQQIIITGLPPAESQRGLQTLMTILHETHGISNDKGAVKACTATPDPKKDHSQAYLYLHRGADVFFMNQMFKNNIRVNDNSVAGATSPITTVEQLSEISQRDLTKIASRYIKDISRLPPGTNKTDNISFVSKIVQQAIVESQSPIRGSHFTSSIAKDNAHMPATTKLQTLPPVGSLTAELRLIHEKDKSLEILKNFFVRYNNFTLEQQQELALEFIKDYILLEYKESSNRGKQIILIGQDELRNPTSMQLLMNILYYTHRIQNANGEPKTPFQGPAPDNRAQSNLVITRGPDAYLAKLLLQKGEGILWPGKANIDHFDELAAIANKDLHATVAEFLATEQLTKVTNKDLQTNAQPEAEKITPPPTVLVKKNNTLALQASPSQSAHSIQLEIERAAQRAIKKANKAVFNIPVIGNTPKIKSENLKVINDIKNKNNGKFITLSSHELMTSVPYDKREDLLRIRLFVVCLYEKLHKVGLCNQDPKTPNAIAEIPDDILQAAVQAATVALTSKVKSS